MNTTHDPIELLLDLAADHGLELCAHCLAENTEEAGELQGPLDDAGDLTGVEIAACELLLRVAFISRVLVARGHLGQHQLALRIRVAARITSLLIPPVMWDHEGRYVLAADADGYLPHAEGAELGLSRAEDRLRDYVREHDAGEWVDPHAVAGAVADLHDAARLLHALLDITTTADRRGL